MEPTQDANTGKLHVTTQDQTRAEVRKLPSG